MTQIVTFSEKIADLPRSGYQLSIVALYQFTPVADTNGREAFIAVVYALVDMGRKIPSPSFCHEDAEAPLASGKFVAHMPKTIHAQLATRAKTEGVLLNTLVLTFIAEGLGRHERRA